MRLAWLGLLQLSCVATALPCSCVSNSTACGSLTSTPIVFVGKVTVDSGEGNGKGPATMVVQEILHGIPKDVREVQVDTSAGTSCYMRLQLGETYVIYGGSKKDDSVHVVRQSCSFSFNVRGNESLLDALRVAEEGGPPRLLGRVYQMTGKYAWGDGVPGIRVTAQRETTQIETQTQANGQFAFSNVLSGEYVLRVNSPNYFQDPAWAESPTGKLIVPKTGCEDRSLYVWPDNAISGVVSDENGKPLQGVPVQVFQPDRKGEMDSSPLRESLTDNSGNYSIHGLPAGDYFIGINGEKYSDKLPFPPTFYPAVHRRGQASKITLTSGRTGVDLTLPPPRPTSTVYVETVFEDGSPAVSAVIMAEDAEGIQRAFVMAPEKSTSAVHTMNLFMGDRYLVKSSEFQVEPLPSTDGRLRFSTRHWAGTTGPVTLDAPEVRVRVVLHDAPLGKR